MNGETTQPSKGEQSLRWLLRCAGSVSLLAVIAVFMPYSWMDATHRALGMGPLPAEPVVGYLARSLSAFYALLGGLLWVYSFDLHRHRVAIGYLGAAFVVFGATLIGVDFAEGMPPFWRWGEGPIVIGFGTAMLWLAARLRRN